MFNFILRYKLSDAKVTVQIQEETLAKAKSAAESVLGSGYVFVDVLSISQIFIINKDNNNGQNISDVQNESQSNTVA